MDRELEMRFEYFWHGLTGQKTESMKSIEKRHEGMEFKRLDDLRWSLTHWTILKGKNWWLMLFPYGLFYNRVTRDDIFINNLVFSFCYLRRKK